MKFFFLFWCFFGIAYADFETTEISLFQGGKLLNLNNSSPFNPDNALEIDERYSDSRAYYGFKYNHEKLPQASAYLRMKAKYLKGNAEEVGEIEVDEGYLSLNPLNGLYLDFGKKNFEYGNFFGFTTFNFFETQNPLIKEDNEYRNTITASYFYNENISLAFSVFNDSQNIFKISFNFKNSDLNFYSFKQEMEEGFGFDFSLIASENLKLKTSGTIYSEKTNLDGNSYFKDYNLLFGGEYNFTNGVGLILEYLYNSYGNSKKGYKEYIDLAQQSPAFGMYSNLFYNFLDLNKNYLFFMVYKKNIYSKFDLQLASYYNIEDGGFLPFADASWNVDDNLKISVRAILPLGSENIEFKRFNKGFLLLRAEYYFK